MKYIDIPDTSLKKAINESLVKYTGKREALQDITEEEMSIITTLYIDSRGISDLTGLRYAKNLNYINLPYNNIRDINEIGYLTKLEKLILWHNKIEDITPLSNLKNLKHLEIDDNKIISIEPLKNLNQLITLWASYNNINSIKDLENLTNLKYLYLNNNEIEDINPLKNLVDIEYLGLHYNKIKDVEVLKNLTNLKVLGVSKNKINDLSKLSELSLESGFFAWDQVITVNAIATSENTYKLDLNLLKDRNNKIINITNLDSGSYDKENNIIKWSHLPLPHQTTFQFNNGMLVYENNSFYGTVIVKILENNEGNQI